MSSDNPAADAGNAHTRRLEKLRQSQKRPAKVKEAAAPVQQQVELIPKEEEVSPPVAVHETTAVKQPGRSRRKAAIADAQGDFFTPMLYDVGTRDSRGVMDVAVFRLSKREKRENAVIRYELPDGHVIVTSGPQGMASVWDYDIVLMAVSHLTEAMNRYRDGKGEKPSQTFKPHVGDVLKFCRKDNGGNQKDAVVGALERLSTTHVAIERKVMIGGKLKIVNSGESLIGGGYRTISNAKKKLEFVEFKIADWMYDEITKGARPDVLTVHPDYFLRESGIARFIYRLARKAAGRDMARWSFRLLFERSGSTGTLKEFTRGIRELIAADDLPEYSLAEEPGKEGPILAIVHRAQADKWKEGPPAPPKSESQDQ